MGFKVCMAEMPNCAYCGSRLEETAEHFYYYDQVCTLWDFVGEVIAHISPQHGVHY